MYDVEDYAEEWIFLSELGISGDEIIARSQPNVKWFQTKILPLVTLAICGTCRTAFNPQAARSLFRCGTRCGNEHLEPANKQWASSLDY